MSEHPKFVSIVAFALGCGDLLRGIAHTIFSGHAAQSIAGLSLLGSTGHDQLVLMTAFGASNFITGAALIYLALRDRSGALIMMTLIPFAYVAGRIGLNINGTGLMGQGEFPGRYMMTLYLLVCTVTVIAACKNYVRKQMHSNA